MLVLIVDDDQNINSMLREYLEKAGYKTLSAFDGKEALKLFEAEKPDVIVLDLMLPEIEGTEVCKKIRSSSDVPILMLTALSDEVDKLIGLEIGADDYITKPFSPREVAARIKTIMRRCRGRAAEDELQERLTCGDLSIDMQGCVVKLRGEVITLTATEYKILETFARHPGKVLSRSQIAEMAYGNAFEGYDRTIDAHIKNIRQKLALIVPGIDHIQTSRGLGYKFII